MIPTWRSGQEVTREIWDFFWWGSWIPLVTLAAFYATYWLCRLESKLRKEPPVYLRETLTFHVKPWHTIFVAFGICLYIHFVIMEPLWLARVAQQWSGVAAGTREP